MKNITLYWLKSDVLIQPTKEGRGYVFGIQGAKLFSSLNEVEIGHLELGNKQEYHVKGEHIENDVFIMDVIPVLYGNLVKNHNTVPLRLMGMTIEELPKKKEHKNKSEIEFVSLNKQHRRTFASKTALAREAKKLQDVSFKKKRCPKTHKMITTKEIEAFSIRVKVQKKYETVSLFRQ